MGGFDENGKLIETGGEAFLKWARKNQTEFYRMYDKMIPRTEELSDDLHEDFIAELIFEEEQAKVIEEIALLFTCICLHFFIFHFV